MKKKTSAQSKRMSLVGEGIAQGLREAVGFVRGERSARVTAVEVPGKAPAYSARQVAAIRKRLGLTQRRFALLMNVSEQSVEGWESGKKSPGPASRRLIQLASDPKTLDSMARYNGYRIVKIGKQRASASP